MTIVCGSLFTPTPALVLAATSTRYTTPTCSPPTTTERMAASTVLFTWKRVSFPRHQIYSEEVEKQKTIWLHVVLYKSKKNPRRLTATYLVLLDDAVLVVWRRGIPGDANGSAVLVSHGQDCYLLRRGTGGCKKRHKITLSTNKWLSSVWKRS